MRLSRHLGLVGLEARDRDRGRGLRGTLRRQTRPQRRTAVRAEPTGRIAAVSAPAANLLGRHGRLPRAAGTPRMHWWHTGRGQTLHPHLRLMVHRNLCVRYQQGQQTTRRGHPEHHPRRRLRRGRAAGRPALPRPPARRGAVPRRLPRGSSCRTTSQTTSRAIPLDRNRPARGAGRTPNADTCRPGHSHNVRNHQTVSTTHRDFGAPTPRRRPPAWAAPLFTPHHDDDDRA